MLSTKEELYQYLEKISRNFTLKNLKYFTANHISESLNISRNLASQYLNELVKEERAIKVNSRPVYFFHRKNVERETQTGLDTCVFSSLDEFQRKCRSVDERMDFQKAIGFGLSLSPCIEQCKAAVKYPPNGLPALFYGAAGTGKSFLARLMFEYGVNTCTLVNTSSAPPPYVAVDCTEYAQNEERFALSFCGAEDGKGWLSRANGGVLFFDEIDRLPFSSQELICSFLTSGQYKSSADDDRVFESNARLIFSTAKPPAEVLFKPLSRMIPIVIPIPALQERTADEREEMLVSFLKSQGRRMGVDVSISQNAFHCILEFPFENNIDGLINCITSSCAGAYLEKQEDCISIQSYHLPEYMLSSLKLEITDQNRRMIHMNSYSRDTSLAQAVQFYQMILEAFEEYRQERLSFEQMIQEGMKQLYDFNDYLLYEQKLVNIKLVTWEQLINQVFESVSEMYGISLSKKYSHLLARCLYIQLQGNNLIDQWLKQNQREIEDMYQDISSSFPKEADITSRIISLIKANLDIEVNTLNQLLLLLDIKNQRQMIHNISAAGIILSHGYATASSIADAANQIIGRKVFDAIDMPLDTQMEDAAKLLEKHIEHYITGQDIILLVDMGSLEQIHEKIKGLPNINIGIINNISTALAVDIGMGICSGKHLEEILKQASESTICTYRIINNALKEDAVIFSGENGINTTEKLKELIIKTSGPSIPLKFIAYDYYRLVKNGSRDEIFRQYHVKCIIGLFNPEIEGIPFISLEDIISMDAAEKLNALFSNYLNEEQMESFNQNLLKNFSLQNVVESITILNPSKLLDEVEQAVSYLQKITERRIADRSIIGLYVHLCCLVERLVTKTPIEHYQNLGDFEQLHSGFIQQVTNSFQDISRHYQVTLPVSEIAYIYDYINLNTKNKLSGQAYSPVIHKDE